jgi:formate-dependent nitrite reductase membrane component NrfD
MNFGIEWGIPVVIYLYFGGLSAGTFVLSAFLSYLRDDKFERLAAAGAIFSPIPLYIGLFMLLIDLERPLAFWRLFATIQWTSPMSIGSWLLMVFSLISTLHALLWLPRRFSTIKLKNLTLSLPRNRERLRGILGAVGFPVGLGVGIYTGVLLGAVPARPFWNTPMVAMLFLISALSTATAVLLLVSTWNSRKQTAENFHRERKLLYSTDVVLILFEIFLVIPYILHNSLSTASQATSLQLILGGEFSPLFWFGFVGAGLLVPLVLETLDLTPDIARRQKPHHIKILGYLSASLVLVGGFMLRYVFVFAGQASHFGVD